MIAGATLTRISLAKPNQRVAGPGGGQPGLPQQLHLVGRDQVGRGDRVQALQRRGGVQRGDLVRVAQALGKTERVEANLALVEDLCQTLKFGSLCALGGFTPYPVMSAIRHFPEDFDRPRLAAAAAD